MAASCFATPAAALSLGTPHVRSYLGQPLYLRVPVVLEEGAEGAHCVSLVGQQGSDLPTLVSGRIEIERVATNTFLRISTLQPIDEPILRVVLEVGCLQRVRREFTLLIDPPAVTGRDTQVAEAPSIEFGAPQVLGHRGQPLLVHVPISGAAAGTLSSGCVHVGRTDTTELPRVLNDARVTLVDRDGTRALRIHTPEPVNDSRVRVLLDVGCDRPLRREFVMLLEEPRLASTPSQASEPVVATAPVQRPAPRPPVRRAPPPVVTTPPAPAPAVPPLAGDTKSTRPAEPPAEPPAQSRTPPGQNDRLVLAAPEDVPVKQDDPSARETEMLKRMEELAAEVQRLRAELDAAAVRNRQLAERDNTSSSWTYALAAAAGAAFLLAVMLMFGWRSRPREETPRPSSPEGARTGPMTRILGTKTEKAPAAQMPKFTEGAGPATIAAIQAAHRAAHEQDTQGASSAMVVTEFRDTTQVIGELYSPYLEKNPTRPGTPVPQPAAPQKTEIALDLDLGQERTTMVAPPTKTEIAVDIDVFESNSQIGRDLQKEYERFDVKPAPPPAKKEEEPDPASLLGGTTMPMTTKLALDLDLDLSTVAKPKDPLKPE